MKKIWFLQTCFLFTLIACQNDKISNLKLEGDLVAKNLISVRSTFPESAENKEYAWSISQTKDGEWQQLPGIRTDSIILLTSYVGRYLKCEISCSRLNSNEKITGSIVSANPVLYKGNPKTDWLKDAGYGIMVHYLKESFVPDGGPKEWNNIVNSFDAESFAGQVKETGAGFVMFTLGQNSGYYCSPNASFNKAVGTSSGELCSTRDLPMAIIKELSKYNIPLILYLPSNPPINNLLVSEKLKYAYKKDSSTSQFNQPIFESMIKEWSLRYGTGVKGWWFDGLYDWNNIRSTRLDMSLNHNISTQTLAAKAGNINSIVTYNYGFGKIHANTPYCDYSSGEKQTIDEFPSSRWAEDGVQWFLFTYLGENWGGKGMQFKTEDLVAKAEKIVRNEGVLCLEVVTNSKGEILPHHLEQMKQIREKLR